MWLYFYNCSIYIKAKKLVKCKVNVSNTCMVAITKTITLRTPLVSLIKVNENIFTGYENQSSPVNHIELPIEWSLQIGLSITSMTSVYKNPI